MADPALPPDPAALPVVVLGAGIAGLAAADRLARAGHRVIVLEASARCGGTHRSRNIGPYTFDVGSIFYEDGSRLFELADGLREMCPAVQRRQRRIAPSGHLLHYPLEPRETLLQFPLRLPAILADIAWSRLFVRRDGSLEAILRQRLGQRLLNQTGLAAYVARFHHVPARDIDELFFFHRMAFVERMTRLGAMLGTGWRSLLARGPGVAGRKRKDLHIRPAAGYDELFLVVRQRLEAAGVEFRFGAAVQAIARQPDGSFAIRTAAGSITAPAVVSTIPLNALHEMLFGQPTGLASLHLTSLFVSAGQLHPDTGNVLFNFHTAGRWKRATIYSRMYPHLGEGRAFFTVEITIPPGGAHDPEAGFADFAAHLQALGIADDLRLEGSERVEDAYPLYAPGSVALLEQALARVAAAGVITVGRQGRFEYLPTSNGVVFRVREELAAAGLTEESNP